MKYGSVCSGIEAATVAWHQLGWTPSWFAEIEPFPCSVLSHHYPHVPNLGDMTKIKKSILQGRVEAPDLLVGGTPCFTANHLVLCSDGYKKIQDVCVGDLVVSHKGRLCPVLKVGFDIKPVGKMSMLGMAEGLTCTPEHPFLSRMWKSQSTKRNNKYFRNVTISDAEFIPAENMVGRQWIALTNFDVQLPIIPTNRFTEAEVMILAGMYLGDGWIRGWANNNKKVLMLGINHQKLEWLKEKIPSVAKASEVVGQAVKVSIYCTELSNWLNDNFGSGASSKKIPSWVLSHPLRQLLIDGYEITDGSNSDNQTTINTVSKELAYGVRDVYHSLGKVGSINYIKKSPTTVIEGRTVSQKDYWQLRVWPISISRKARVIDNHLLRNVSDWSMQDNPETVYNIEVGTDNSYIVNGAVVHNCQAFSIAGLRNSLDDQRGQLTLEFVRLANAIDFIRAKRKQQPSVIVWENVPGVLSSKDNAFGCFLAGLVGESSELQPAGNKWTNAGCVFGPERAVAWRVLDAQYFGLAQRRRRVFVVASARKDINCTKILFEFDSVRRDIAPSRESKQNVAATIEASLGRSRGAGTPISALTVDLPAQDPAYCLETTSHDYSRADGFNTVLSLASKQQSLDVRDNVASALLATDYKEPQVVCVHGTQDPCTTENVAHTLGRNNGQENAIAYAFDSLSSNSMKSSNPHSGCRQTEIAKTLDTTVPCPSKNQGGIGVLQNNSEIAYGIPGNWIGRKPENGGNATEPPLELSPCLTVADVHAVSSQMQVRRLTPKECERLQGFPDDYTLVPHNKKIATDSPRYKALGNSMAVPVMHWIGQRIQQHLKKEVAA